MPTEEFLPCSLKACLCSFPVLRISYVSALISLICLLSLSLFTLQSAQKTHRYGPQRFARDSLRQHICCCLISFSFSSFFSIYRCISCPQEDQLEKNMVFWHIMISPKNFFHHRQLGGNTKPSRNCGKIALASNKTCGKLYLYCFTAFPESTITRITAISLYHVIIFTLFYDPKSSLRLYIIYTTVTVETVVRSGLASQWLEFWMYLLGTRHICNFDVTCFVIRSKVLTINI